MSDPKPMKQTFTQYVIVLFLFVIISAGSIEVHAQAKPNSEPDVIVFTNGEKLIGHFESFIGGSAKFKSDTLGEVTVDLKKIQEFHTSQKFAVIEKDVKLGRNKVDGQIPRGTISIADQKVAIDPGNGQAAQTIAVGDLNNIIDQASFDQAFRHPGIFDDWKGAFAVGGSFVEATQDSLSLNTAVNLTRALPTENWMAPANRSIIDFSQTYGKVTQPGTPEVRTSIYHADGERDEYFTARVYGLAAIAFDHNFSQGLDLQQTYGGGIGWTVVKQANQTLDFKGTVNYEKQSFDVLSQSQYLVNSIFTETYSLKFGKNILFKEQAAASPAWTNMHAYSAYASTGITLPVYKRFAFNANVIDSFLNDPPPTFKKNSIQFTTGISYTLK